MRDLKIVLGVRLDNLSSTMDLEALAEMLALTYAKQRAVEVPYVSQLRDKVMAAGADAAATCMYVVGDERPPSMEYLSVTLRKHATGVWALYQSARYSLKDLTVIHWASVRSVVQNFQSWDGSTPDLPRIWPESPYVKPGLELEFTPAAWEEARAKARDVGVLTQQQEDALLEVLIQFAGDDHPPGFELHPVMVQVVRDRIGGVGPPETTQVLLRNSDGVKTMHDLRGWAWQCAWAISKRASKSAQASADEPREQAIRRLMRDLATRIQSEASTSGPFEPIRQSLPTRDSARVELEVVAVPDGTRELVVRVDKKGVLTQTLARGTNRELVLFLVAPMAAQLVSDAVAQLEATDPATASARRELEQQTIELARQMRDAIDRYDDPDVVAQRQAYERAKAERIGARLASFYVKTGQRDGNEPLDQAISKMLRYFAQRIDAELPEVGNAATIDQPLPTLDSGALVWLDLVATSPARELMLRIKSPDGKTTKSMLLLRGTKLKIITYLEASSRPSDLIAAIDELAASVS